MKTITSFLLCIIMAACAHSKNMNYTGSTPANAAIKIFLGIPTSDSIDFIRWKLVLNDRRYSLDCNYGIGKPNTDGFINGGKKVQLSGTVTRDKNYYWLQNGSKSIAIAEINQNLLHFANKDRTLMSGTGGWSYTLNSLSPTATSHLSFASKNIAIKDSVAFHGRTPCGKLSAAARFNASDCYKLKWYIILYTDARGNPANYFMRGTAFHQEGYNITGIWNMTTGNDGRNIYRIVLPKNEGVLYFVRPEENVLLAADPQGNLLVGNKDFSYTLSRKE